MATTSAPMDAETREQLLRAARGELRSSAGFPIGIRYRPLAERPVPAPSPAADRLRQSVLAGPGVLAEIAEAPRVSGPRSRTKAVGARPPASTSPAAATVPTQAGPTRRRPRTSGAAGGTAPQLLHSYRAHACEECGSRYRQPDTEHGCGLLTPVLVTVTRGLATGESSVAVLGSYPAYACETCGDRREQDVPDHGCGPLTPVTVTISRTLEPGA